MATFYKTRFLSKVGYLAANSSKQSVDRLDRTQLAALDLLDHGLKCLQRPRHAQADQIVADPRDRVFRHGGDGHPVSRVADRLPWNTSGLKLRLDQRLAA